MAIDQFDCLAVGELLRIAREIAYANDIDAIGAAGLTVIALLGAFMETAQQAIAELGSSIVISFNIMDPIVFFGAIVGAAIGIATALRSGALPVDGVNLFLADGVAAGQEVLHVHLHVIPRRRGDGFGLRAVPRTPNRTVLDGTAAAIRDALAP